MPEGAGKLRRAMAAQEGIGRQALAIVWTARLLGCCALFLTVRRGRDKIQGTIKNIIPASVALVLSLYSLFSVAKGELGQWLTPGLETDLEVSVQQAPGETRITLQAGRHLECKIDLRLDVGGDIPRSLPVVFQNGEAASAEFTRSAGSWYAQIAKREGASTTYLTWETRDRLTVIVPRPEAKLTFWAVRAKEGGFDDMVRAATRLRYRWCIGMVVALFVLASLVQLFLAFRKDTRPIPASEDVDRLSSLIALVIRGVDGESDLDTDRRRAFLRKVRLERISQEKALDAIPVADRGAFSASSLRGFREQTDELASHLADLKAEKL